MSGPTQLGKYAISEVLGKGAMGVVYKGFDPHIRRTVALKTIRKELIDDDQAATLLARFRNEAQAAGRLSHPGIVAVYEWGEAGELAFLAMEYVQGHDLLQHTRPGDLLPVADVIDVVNRLRVTRLVLLAEDAGIDGDGFIVPEVGRLQEFLEFLNLKDRFAVR